MLKRLLLLATGLVAGMAYGFAPTQFQSCIELTFPQAPAESVTEATVVPVRLSESGISGFQYADVAANGADLVFIDEELNALPYEIETWDPEGESLIWVQVPRLSSSTVVKLYYKEVEAGTTPAPSSPWSDYAGVWHLSSERGSATIGDLTTNYLDPITGVFGGGYNLKGVSSYLAIPQEEMLEAVPDKSTLTIETWVKSSKATPDHGARIVGAKSNYNSSGYDVLYFTQPSNPDKLVCRGNGNNKTAYFDASGVNWLEWNHVLITFQGSSVIAYVNGVALGAAQTIEPVTTFINPRVGNASNAGSGVTGYYDEVRVRAYAASAEVVALEHAVLASDFVHFSDALPVSSTYPALTEVAISGSADGYRVQVTMPSGMGDLYLKLTDGDGVEQSFLVAENLQASSEPQSFAIDTSTLAPNVAYAVEATVRNSLEEATSRTMASALFTGEITITKQSDGREYGYEPATFAFALPEGVEALAYPVAVQCVAGGTAVEGVNYEAIQWPVVIPAGSNSATLSVTPIKTGSGVDTTLSLTLAAGPFLQPELPTAEATISALQTPAEYNVWIAKSDGLASDAANWSKGVPQATDRILLDADFSTAAMTWDAGVNGLPSTIAELKIASNVTTTNLIATTFDESFPIFTITGDCTLEGGTLGHLPNGNTQMYRLALRVGGNFLLSANAVLDGWQRGMAPMNKATNNGAVGIHAGLPHPNMVKAVCGNVYEPTLVGNGGGQGWGSTAMYAGGGAIWLEATGDVVLNGRVDVRSTAASGGWSGQLSGAPGSVYVRGRTIAGAGEIQACAPLVARRGAETPTGGRVALIVTGSDVLDFPLNKVSIYGARSTYLAGGGTCYYKTTASTYGTLYLDNQQKATQDTCGLGLPLNETATVIPKGERWCFDAIIFSRGGTLTLLPDTTLALPNGLASISGGTEWGGLILNGGTLELPEGDQTIQGGWVFQAQEPYTFEGNLLLREGGRLGVTRRYATTNSYPRCVVTVSGDMTVEEGSYIWARGGGLTASKNFEDSPEFIFNGYYSHGGQTALQPELNSSYDSVFNPALPGSMGTGNDGASESFGGGAVTLTVSGKLQLDGEAIADSQASDTWLSMGSGGTLNFTLGSLTGRGRISASGMRYRTSANYLPENIGKSASRGWSASSAGGRIAVRLTQKGANFSAFDLSNIEAKGGEFVDGSANQATGFAGAGTIYLQDAAQREGFGTILVRNTGNAANTTGVTPLPSQCWGGENDQYNQAALQLEANAIVKLYDSLKMRKLALTEGCAIDLNGQTLRVKDAGRLVGTGTYTALSGKDWIKDSSEGGTGQLIVEGMTTIITVY